MARTFFGTDGIRGKVGEHPITAEFVLKLGWAAGKVFGQMEKLESADRPLILVGKDTRVSGYMFESAIQAGLIAAGVDVGLMGPMPTPAIAYLTTTFRAKAGIVISASHNPFWDNGIKFFGSDGFKLPDEIEERIESHLSEPLITSESSQLGRAFRIDDAEGRYVEFCKGTLPFGFNLRGLKIVIDCANGATYHVAPNVFMELGARVQPVAVDPDGLNINEDCGSTKPSLLQQAVVDNQADMGIAFDGDGDRVLFVDHKGEIVDGDELLYVIASHRQKNGGCTGVAGTLMTNLGLELALEEMGVPFVRTRVGDRYVIEAMRTNKWKLGGENSGHIICSDLTTTGDGIVAALQVLQAMKESGKSLHELKASMQKFPQFMVNVKLKGDIDISGNQAVRDSVKQAEKQLGKRGRVLLRPSGTEPLIRVMVEGENTGLVKQLAHTIAEVVQSEVI